MKRHPSSIVLAALLLILAAATVQATVRPNVLATGFRVADGSAEVGRDFTLRLKLTNIEPAACAYRVTATVKADFPFILDGLNTFSAEDLCKGSSTFVDVPMKIDPTATGGFYQMTVTMNYETTTLAQFSSSSTINLYVEGSPEINAYITGSEPVDVYPGDTAKVTVTVQNDGSFEVQSATASASAEEPLDVKWSGSFSSLGEIGARKSKTADFIVEVPKNASSGDYPFFVDVSYLDENLYQRTANFDFKFHVSEKAMFEASDSGSDTLYPDENSNTIRAVVKNTGSDTAYKLKVKVLPQFPFSTDGSLRYIEEIAPGASEPMEFRIDIDKDATIGKYSTELLLDYEDAEGKKFQDTTVLAMSVKPKTFYKAVISDYWFLWVLALVILSLVIIKKVKAVKKKADGGSRKKKK